MLIFETILILLLGATILSEIAKRLHIPYPVLLALGGACVALLPFSNAPQLDLSPELILTLFVAPILLNAAHNTSLRDLREHWLPVLFLVFVAVGLTTFAVALVTHWLIPDFPWAASIALGALLAPPDAVAAMAVLGQVKLPHRIRTVLEGESLLNDASALLIYKLAVTTVMAGSYKASDTAPILGLVVFGSIIAGWVMAKIVGFIMERITYMPTSVIFQFVSVFGVWLLAEYLRLSEIVTIVVFGFTMTRYSMLVMPARLRISTFAIWESVTFILNVLAFTLVGLQMRSILKTLNESGNQEWLWIAVIILGVVITVRLFWVMGFTLICKYCTSTDISCKGGFFVAWSGMRGIVTLAAAMALPKSFPYHDFIQLTAFVVVLGTLLIQGLTLKPLITLLGLPNDNKIDNEINKARGAALKAAILSLEGNNSAAANRLRQEYNVALLRNYQLKEPHETDDNTLRRQVAIAARHAILELHNINDIGDEAYRLVEEELDWFELSATPQTADKE